MRRFVINDPRAAKFIADSVGSTDTQCYSSVALEVDGQIRAAASFDNFTGANAFLHFSNTPDPGIIPRDFLKLVFGYAFNHLKLKRLSAAFSSKNRVVCRLGQLCGFKFEAVLKGAASDGDLVIYKLTRENCRFII